MARRRFGRGMALLALFTLLGAAAPAQEPETGPLGDLAWIEGPATGRLGDVATVEVPEGYAFLAAEDTKRILEAMGNLTNGSEVGAVFPKDDDWFLLFEYEAVGYVKDDDRDELDAAAMLEAMKKSSAAGNEQRRKRGLPAMTVTGWEIPPQYDPATNNLEWALRFDVENQGPVVNQNTRLLGRKGVMSATLVADPGELAAASAKADELLAGYGFVAGQRYAEFTRGDKIAKYGLTGLVLGGAAAAAVKTGLFQKFWKLIVVGLAAAASFLKRLFGRSKGAAPGTPPVAPGA